VENLLHENFTCGKMLTFLCKLWQDLKKSGIIHGQTLYPETSYMGSNVW